MADMFDDDDKFEDEAESLPPRKPTLKKKAAKEPAAAAPATKPAKVKPAAKEPAKKTAKANAPDPSDVIGDNARAELRHIIDRIERLDEEAAAVAADKKEVFAEAKSHGFCTKTIRAIIARRRKDEDALAEAEAMFDLYWGALGEYSEMENEPGAKA